VRSASNNKRKKVYRVVTDSRDRNGNKTNDHGPWLKSRDEAEYWANLLRGFGYNAEVQELSGLIAQHSH